MRSHPCLTERIDGSGGDDEMEWHGSAPLGVLCIITPPPPFPRRRAEEERWWQD